MESCQGFCCWYCYCWWADVTLSLPKRFKNVKARKTDFCRKTSLLPPGDDRTVVSTLLALFRTFFSTLAFVKPSNELHTATSRRTHCVTSHSLLIMFQKRQTRDPFVSTLFNQGLTWLKRTTPNLVCVIYVLPQQIASQGNQPFIFWDIIPVAKEIPPALTSNWYQPLLHLSGI